MARRTHVRNGPAPEAGAPSRRPRGAVVRSGGALVRRVSAYVDPDTYRRLRAEAGETSTVSEVVTAALRAYLDRRSAKRPPPPQRKARAGGNA